ncbi:TIGR02281 family clan AA aspartic protease [Sphingomonas sp. GC_Shp_3]|uniref:retropepsin-like aspartic protease family protein n=1 Tax=Sphingomonas sp. GC_Shp_3 TaxID=2937383 RepID=UPI002269F87A
MRAGQIDTISNIADRGIVIDPQWQHLALYALGAAVLLSLLFRVPYVGRILRALFSVTLLALCLFMVLQQAPYEPGLARISSRLGLDTQTVAGREVRVPMALDGHFWATAAINGVPRRMLIDSGATVTALSSETADLASVAQNTGLMPVMMQTANGIIRAETGTINHLSLGGIRARGLKVVISPALGHTDILGMNFLSRLSSWRVEGRTLILVPVAKTAPVHKGRHAS